MEDWRPRPSSFPNLEPSAKENCAVTDIARPLVIYRICLPSRLGSPETSFPRQVIVLWRHSRGTFLLPWLILCVPSLLGQDASTGAIRGTVADSFGHAIVDASVALVDSAQGFHYFVTSDSAGQFVFEFLPPGEYAARAVAPDMPPELTPKLEVHADATTELDFKLQFRVSSNTYGAELGRAGGAVINVVTKSGSNPRPRDRGGPPFSCGRCLHVRAWSRSHSRPRREPAATSEHRVSRLRQLGYQLSRHVLHRGFVFRLADDSVLYLPVSSMHSIPSPGQSRNSAPSTCSRAPHPASTTG
jgi:hypothetical protein